MARPLTGFKTQPANQKITHQINSTLYQLVKKKKSGFYLIACLPCPLCFQYCVSGTTTFCGDDKLCSLFFCAKIFSIQIIRGTWKRNREEIYALKCQECRQEDKETEEVSERSLDFFQNPQKPVYSGDMGIKPKCGKGIGLGISPSDTFPSLSQIDNISFSISHHKIFKKNTSDSSPWKT